MQAVDYQEDTMTTSTDIRIGRRVEQQPFRAGDIIAAWLRDDEIAALEAEQSLSASEVPSSKPARPGRRLVAVYVTAAWTHDHEWVEDMDAWHHAHEATVRLATADEASALLADRQDRLTVVDDAKAETARLTALAAELLDGYTCTGSWMGDEGRDYYVRGALDGAEVLLQAPEERGCGVEPRLPNGYGVHRLHRVPEGIVSVFRGYWLDGWSVYLWRRD